MNKLSLNQTWVATLILGVGSAAYLYFSFLPTQRQIGELRAEIETRQNFIREADNLVTPISASRQNLDAAAAFSESWRLSAPETGRLSELFADISTAAIEHEIKITHFDPEDPTTLELLAYTPVRIGIEGKYSAIQAFTQAIETHRSTIWIENFNLNANSTTQDRLHCELSLRIFTDNSEENE